MKKIGTILICTVALFQVVNAQCINNSSTSPYKGTDAAKIKDWKVNKFDWMNFGQDFIKLNNAVYGTITNQLGNPFRAYQYKNYRWPIIGDKDIKNGWELIKQDLGYFNNDNMDIPFKRKVSTSSRGDALIPYIILYNKYRGTLRIMGYMVTDTKNFVKVTLSFNNKAPNLDKKTDKAIGNGILRQYEKSGETALDKPTTVVDEVSQYAVNSNYLTSLELFFADFQLSYDPCICQFYSGLDINFEGVEQATLKAFSKTVDISEARNNPDVLASVFDDGNGNVQGGIASFKSVDDLKTQMSAIAGSSAYDSETKTFLPQVVNLIADANKGLKDYKEGYEKVGEAFSVANVNLKKFEIGEGVFKLVTNASKILGAVGVMTDVISLFTGEDTKAIANPSVSAITGTVTKKSTPSGFALATPGSVTSNESLTFANEYASEQADYNSDGTQNTNNSGWYTNSVRPMYNEIPGVYAMLKTPSVSYNIKSGLPEYPLYATSGYASTNIFSFKLPNNNDNIQFTLNPSLSIIGYTFKYALQIKVTGDYDSRLGIHNPIRVLDGLKIAYRYELGSYMLMTPYMSYQELSNYTPLVTLVGASNDITIESIKLKVGGLIIFNELNSNGENNSQIFSRTFDLKATNTPFVIVPYPKQFNGYNFFYANNDFNCIPRYSNIPDELLITNPNVYANNINTINACGITNPLNVYAKDKITINTKENIANQLNFYSKEIVVEGESTLEGEVILDSKISIFGTELPQDPLPVDIDNNFYTRYCGNSTNTLTYKAYQTSINARMEEEATTTPSTPTARTISSPKLQITPNPTTGQVTFYYSLPTDGHVSLCISNVMGVKVLDVIPTQTMPSGAYQKTIDVSTLPTGVYLVSIQTDGGKLIERMVVSE